MIIAALLIAVCTVVALSPIGVFAVARPEPVIPPGQPPLDLEREEYFAERRLLLEARQRGYQAVDQMVTGGATGALLLSITFLEKLVTKPTVSSPGLLLWSWAFLLGTLTSAAVGQQYSARSFDCEILRLEALLEGEPPIPNIWSTLERGCNVLGKILFLTGIVFLAWFAYLNAPFHLGGSQ